MSRIGATLSGFELQLLNRLRAANAEIEISSLRLATHQKINAPSDDPSGYTQLANWETQKTVVTAAQANVTAASSIVSQTQLVIDQLRTQLNTIRSKAIDDADQELTSDERIANQAAIDAAVAKINELAASDVNGRRVLDGSANYVFSGLNTNQVFDLDVVNKGDANVQAISGQVTIAATQAQLTYTTVAGTASADATFTLMGDRGNSEISVTNGDSISDITERINQESHLTGITAAVNGNNVVLKSINYGSNADIGVDVSSGTFAVTGGNGDGTANGINATATINGRTLTGDGNRFSLNDNRFQFTIEFKAGFVGTFDSISVSGDALTFALTTNVGRKSSLALRSLQASRLGGLSGNLAQLATGGSLAGLNTNAPYAVRVADEAISMLTRIEGRVEGFADETIASSAALLSGMKTQLGKAIDTINKVDVQEEAALLAKNEALASNAIAALSILDQQRTSIVRLIQSIAGLN